MVMEVNCANHPYQNSSSGTGGGICAFCLQEKLRKLISETGFPSSSCASSSSPSFRSADVREVTLQDPYPLSSSCTAKSQTRDIKRPRLPFPSTHKKKNQQLVSDEDGSPGGRRGFWSFLHSKHKKAGTAGGSPSLKDLNFTAAATTMNRSQNGGVDEQGDGHEEASIDHKISRSRSIGCGSRNFSGDIFEKLSTGLGDCSLRRVASQREAKQHRKGQQTVHKSNGLEGIKEKVIFSGILSGLMMTSPSSSSSSSSFCVQGNTTTNSGKSSHARSRSWGWVFASPMRALGRPPSGKKESSSSKSSSTPNLSAIPSLLTVS